MNALEWSRTLAVLGALPFLLLGVAHAVLTPRTALETKGLSPKDPAVREAMARDRVVLTKQANVWLAWVGFNMSHSLGAVLFGVAMVLIARTTDSFTAQAGVFLPFAVIVSAIYLVLGVKYWFKTPILGIAFSLVCFLASWGMFLSLR